MADPLHYDNELGLLQTRPLNRALQQVRVFGFFDPGPGGSADPREAPGGPPSAFPGPPGASRRPPGPRTNQRSKFRNLKKFIDQWRRHVSSSRSGTNIRSTAAFVANPNFWAAFEGNLGQSFGDLVQFSAPQNCPETQVFIYCVSQRPRKQTAPKLFLSVTKAAVDPTHRALHPEQSPRSKM
jgi:hypothetical protein